MASLVLALVLGGLAVSPAADAQQAGKIPRVGILSMGHPPAPGSAPDQNQGFRQGLRGLGYEEGRSIVLEWRYAEQHADRLPQLAAELIRLQVDVLHVGGPEAVKAVHNATTTIPIVMVSGADPVAGGLVASLARPGGNLTGLTVTYPELAGKRLELLTQAIPGISRVATVWDSSNAPLSHPGRVPFIQSMDAATRALGLRHQILEVWGPDDLERALDNAVRQRVQALNVTETAMIFFHRDRLAKLAAARRLPAIAERKVTAQAGFLLSYGSDLTDLHRRAAVYVDKILKGASPGELPIERPDKFELVVNLKTARALGPTIPRSLLSRADEVIE